MITLSQAERKLHYEVGEAQLNSGGIGHNFPDIELAGEDTRVNPV